MVQVNQTLNFGQLRDQWIDAGRLGSACRGTRRSSAPLHATVAGSVGGPMITPPLPAFLRRLEMCRDAAACPAPASASSATGGQCSACACILRRISVTAKPAAARSCNGRVPENRCSAAASTRRAARTPSTGEFGHSATWLPAASASNCSFSGRVPLKIGHRRLKVRAPRSIRNDRIRFNLERALSGFVLDLFFGSRHGSPPSRSSLVLEICRGWTRR